MSTGGKAAQPLPIIFRPEPEAADDATLMRLNIVYRLSTKGAVNEGAIDVANQAPMQHLLNGWAIGVNVDSSKFSFGMEREKKFKLLDAQRSAVAQGVKEDDMYVQSLLSLLRRRIGCLAGVMSINPSLMTVDKEADSARE